jgi:hypothetical protein
MAEMQSNRNDDVFGRTDKQFGIPSIDSLALKYSKAQLQQMAQMGRIPPIYAVMAGMAQDRIQLNNSHAPETTVAQDTFGQQVTDSSGQGITDSSGAAVGAGERVAPQSAADISKAYGGLMSIPRPGEKYNQDNFATGGIVAFQEGGDVRRGQALNYDPKARMPIEDILQFEGLIGGKRKKKEEKVATPIDPATATGGLPPIYSADSVFQQPDPFGRAPTTAVAAETQKQLAKVQPAAAPTGPLAAMAQAAPASDEFAQQGADLMKLPTRTPTNTTGLIDTPEEIAKDREDILNSTIGYAGAEIMAGKSQFAMTNIGEGLSKAFASYAQRIGEHKKLRKSDIKDFATITQADEALKSGDIDRALRAWTHLSSDKDRAKSALDVAEINKQGHLDAERIRAGSKPLDIAHILMYGSPEEKERARGVVSMMNTGKDKTPQDVRIAASTLLSKNDEYAMLSTSDKPAERARAAKMLSDMEAYILTGGMGGGGGYQPTASQLKALNKNQG